MIFQGWGPDHLSQPPDPSIIFVRISGYFEVLEFYLSKFFFNLQHIQYTLDELTSKCTKMKLPTSFQKACVPGECLYMCSS